MFYTSGGRKDGRNSWCKSCSLAYFLSPERRERKREIDRAYHKRVRQRKGYKLEETKRWKEKYPEKATAHRKVNQAVRRGKMEKKPCGVCGNEKTHAHHPDYKKPLEVIWLCPIHHAAIHTGAAPKS